MLADLPSSATPGGPAAGDGNALQPSQPQPPVPPTAQFQNR